MANQMNAIGTYAPRVQLGRTVRKPELVAFIARSTGLNEGTIAMVLAELRDAVLYHNRLGRAVKLEGLGIYTPRLALNGRLRVSHRLDPFLKGNLSLDSGFDGEIINQEHIGKTLEDLIELWNQEHPEDPIP